MCKPIHNRSHPGVTKGPWSPVSMCSAGRSPARAGGMLGCDELAVQKVFKMPVPLMPVGDDPGKRDSQGTVAGV